jgi:2-dehydropantoate 2-reductase
MAKKIAILGAGANGASIGADLTNAGLDVVLIEQWPEHVQTMRSEGLRINMPDETLQLPVRAFQLCDVATFTEKFDVVLVLMKAYDTRWACQLIEPHLKPDALVVGIQNGMTTDSMRALLSAIRCCRIRPPPSFTTGPSVGTARSTTSTDWWSPS